MARTIAIIVHIRQEEAAEFERLFEEEELPVWRDFLDRGRFRAASLTRVVDGSEVRRGVQDYILHVKVPGMAEHQEHDDDPRFREFLRKARAFQTDQPLVWFGDLFEVGT